MSVLFVIKRTCFVVTSYLTLVIIFQQCTPEIPSEGDELALEEIHIPTDQGIK